MKGNIQNVQSYSANARQKVEVWKPRVHAYREQTRGREVSII